VSQHLRVLKEADLVEERRDGTRRLYLAKHDTVADLRRFLDDYWSDTLTRLRDVAEDAERERRVRTRPTRSTDQQQRRTSWSSNERS
jgi:DNA-binding transcriptional ArsR family regulator